jgi:transposase
MTRKSIPVHLRKSGPGTGGRNWDRDQEISALKASTGMSNDEIGKRYKLSRESIRLIVSRVERDKRLDRTRWMSAAERRAEFLKELGKT